MMRSKTLAAVLTLVLGALAITSCGSGSGGSGPSTRIVNAAYNAPYNFDVLLNSVSTVTDMGYLQATAFQSIPTGGTTVEFEPTGTTTNAVTASFDAGNGFNYSVLAVEGTGGLTSLVVAQNNSSISVGQTRLTFAGAASGVGTLDFFITSPTAALPSTPSMAPISYAGDGSTVTPTPIIVASGDYRIRAIVDGDTTQTIVYDSGRLTFASGVDLLLAIIPVSGSAAQFSLLSLDAKSSVSQIPDQRVQLRVGNFAPATASVDAYFAATSTAGSSGTLLVSGLTPDAASAYQAVLPGNYVYFTNTGQTTQLVNSERALEASTSVSVFAIGFSGLPYPNNLQLLTLQDNLQTPPTGMANLRIVQLAPDVNNSATNAVDVVTINTSVTPPVITGTLVSNLVYPGASAYRPMSAGIYTVALVPHNLDTPLLPTSAGIVLNLTVGTVWTLVVAGCEYPGTGICSSAPAATLQLVPLQDISVPQL
jgi:hypothetical protein